MRIELTRKGLVYASDEVRGGSTVWRAANA